MSRFVATKHGIGLLQIRLVILGHEFSWRTVSQEKFMSTPFGKDPHSNAELEGRLLTLQGRAFSALPQGAKA